MIGGFRCTETQKIFDGETSTRFPPDIQHTARRKLRMIAAAININDLQQPPGNHLKKLVGDRNNQYSIRVNEQWRLCFEWQDGHAYNVELTKHYE